MNTAACAKRASIPVGPVQRPGVTRQTCGAMLACLAVCFGAAVPLGAATPREEVLRLVPEDVGFCFLVQNLRDLGTAFWSSPFAAQLGKTELGRNLATSAPVRKLNEFDQVLQKHLQITWPQLRDEILGDTVVFAFRPATTGKSEDDQDLVILHARDASLLANFVKRLNEFQIQSGEVKNLQTRSYRGIEYGCRLERNKEQFFCVRDGLLLVSSKESMLRLALDRGQNTSADSHLGRQLRRLGVESALATLWVNPRAFDGQLAQKATTTQPTESLVIRKVQAYWKALDGIALALTVGPSQVELGVTFLAKEGDLPPAARQFFAGDAQPSELWGRFPGNALLAIAGRVDTVALGELVGDFVPEESRRELRQAEQGAGAALGVNLGTDLLPNLGPDWGLCVAAPKDGDRNAVPPAVAVLRVQPGHGNPPLDRALFDGLNSLAMLLVFGHNRTNQAQLALKSQWQEKVEVKYLAGEKVFPAGVQPAYALKDGYLVLATSPQAVREFGAARAPSAAGNAESPLLRMSVRELRKLLDQRLDGAAAYLAKTYHLAPQEASQQLQAVIGACQFFDRLELTRRAEPGRMALLLRLSTEQPLRK